MPRPRTVTPLVPDTPSRAALEQWLAVIGQKEAARLSRIPQQTLSAYKNLQIRPTHERAKRLQLASKGAVRAEGWETQEEKDARKAMEKEIAQDSRRSSRKKKAAA